MVANADVTSGDTLIDFELEGLMQSMRSRWWTGFALLLSLVLGAGLLGSSVAVAATPLENTTWKLTEVALSGTLAPVPDGAVATLRLADGEARGNAGCNAFFSPYTLSGSSLTFGAIGTTRMVCEGSTATAEAAYLQVLGTVAMLHDRRYNPLPERRERDRRRDVRSGDGSPGRRCVARQEVRGRRWHAGEARDRNRAHGGLRT